MNHYEIEYEMIMEIQHEALSNLSSNTGIIDYRLVNLLSASYTIQDYLAGKIAQIGETPEGEDGITWESIKEIIDDYNNHSL